MSCKEYIGYLTSDRINQLSKFKVFSVKRHLWTCKGCRNFTRNDSTLRDALNKRKDWFNFN
jgi:hypothetical protein